MISQDRDYEDLLRGALRAAAASVEPASDGLERIRRRSHSPRSARSTLAGAAEWLRLNRIRLSVRLESFRWALSQRAIRQPAAGAHRISPTPAGKRAGRLGPAAAWFKPAFAVAAVVAVVVVGMVTLNRMQEAVIQPTNSVTSPGHQHRAAAATGLASPAPWQPPLGVFSSPPPGTSRRKAGFAMPAIACTRTPTPSSTPTPTGTPEPTPTPSPSDTPTATPSPSPTPTGTGTASPSGTPTVGTGGSTSTGTSSSTVNATTSAMFLPDTGVSCGSTPTPKTTHTTS